MSDPFLPRVGGVLSADIAVPEHARELSFYASVLGTGADPLWRADLMNSLGAPVIGLGERVPEYESLPLQWMPHLLVADVATGARRAVERGGTELMHGKDDAGASQWAVLVDPNGAAFGIVPVPPADALPSTGGSTRTGHIARIDLTTPDARAALDFYAAVVGWSGREVDAGFALSCADGHPAGTIRHARGAHASLPAVWMITLPVGDLAESLARVRAGGGAVVAETRGEGGACTHAVVRDPVGVHLALVPG